MTKKYEKFSNFKDEIWLQVGNTDYYVSDCGRIKHVYKNGHEHLLSPYVMKRRKQHKMFVKLNGKETNFGKLVYEAFKGPVPEGMYVVHADRNIRNNNLANLILMTPEQSGKYNGWTSCISKMQPVVCLINRKIYPSARQAGKALGVSYQTVMDHCNGKRKNNIYGVRWATETEADQILENLRRRKEGLPKRYKKIGGEQR